MYTLLLDGSLAEYNLNLFGNYSVMKLMCTDVHIVPPPDIDLHNLEGTGTRLCT